MKVIFNSRLQSTEDFSLNLNNRSFCYGDGLFETIVTGPGRINLTSRHVIRLKKGCEIMGIDFPEVLEEEQLNEFISILRFENNLEGVSRTRLTLWRDAGGLYAPSKNSASFFIESVPQKNPLFIKKDVAGVSHNFTTSFSPISFAKTTNALTYVLAGREMQAKGWDDILLCDANGHIAETHIANVFWTFGDHIFTPSLESGCIQGVMRSEIIQFFKESGKGVKEVMSKSDILEKADSLFTANASGISFFKEVNGIEKLFESPEPLLTPLFKRLQLP